MVDAANRVIEIFEKFWEDDGYRAALSSAITDLQASIPIHSHPKSPHYQRGSIQPIDFIAANSLDFFEGNIVKYVSRWRTKGTPLADLQKAKQYLDWLIEMAEDPQFPVSGTMPFDWHDCIPGIELWKNPAKKTKT